ncbi:polysaccharide biosynthesis C-terminal domain-containing protein [Terasakiella sp. A23]|uniref:oligosaccharide flippase family protein n=1 Tax=Terasakiella sp. FCG-A23 TaxID=3080561 RepID=UPI002952B1CC|nr:polysaccharide biosynthesis C-terminal domain-containing protein [Terasakiella sp. A23]MDV7341627.1 polysaccharide biosynthesis C-terminal domain-containing protein [Terasakiella sp. A23]
MAISKIINLLRSEKMMSVLFSFGIKGGSAFFGFVTIIYLTNTMLVSEFGYLSYCLSLVNIILMLCSFGQSSLIIRQTARSIAENVSYSGLLPKALSFSFFLAVICICFTIFSLFFFPSQRVGIQIFLIVAISVPAMVFCRLVSASLQGQYKIRAGQMVDEFQRPAFFLFFYGCANIWLYNTMTSQNAALVFFIANVVASIVAYLVYKRLSGEKSVFQLKFPERQWQNQAFPFFIATSVTFINQETDVLMLGALGSMDDVGLYKPSQKIVFLLSFVLYATNVIVQPKIAAAYTKKDVDALWRNLRWACRIVSLMALPLIIIITLLSDHLLGVFGEGYVKTQETLFILITAHSFNVFIGGMAGSLLNMTQYQKITSISLFVSLIVNVLMNALLIPHLGIKGAAIATLCSFIVWTTTQAYYSWKKLGLYPFLFWCFRKN